MAAASEPAAMGPARWNAELGMRNVESPLRSAFRVPTSTLERSSSHSVPTGCGPASVSAIISPAHRRLQLRKERSFSAGQLCDGIGQMRILYCVSSLGDADAMRGRQHVGNLIALRRYELVTGKLEQ